MYADRSIELAQQVVTFVEERRRLRAGNWRILFHPNFQDRVLVVLRVLPRARGIAGERRRDTTVRTKKLARLFSVYKRVAARI